MIRKHTIQPYLLLFSLIAIAYADQLSVFQSFMTQRINQLAASTLNHFSEFDDECTVLSFDQCIGTSALQCFQDFPKPQGCVSQGASLATESAIRLPPNSVKDALTNEQKHLICRTAELQEHFKSLHQNRDGKFLVSYIGTSTGMYRSYPTSKYDTKTKAWSNGSCKNYDPRFRQWYSSAVSGKKNIVFIFDRSNSLRNYLSTMKITANLLIQTLAIDDRVLTIAIGDEVNFLGSSDNFQNLDTEKKQKIQATLTDITSQGTANLSKAFETSFQLLMKNRKMNNLCCFDEDNRNNVIFTIFTGEPQSSEFSSLRSIIKEYEKQFKIQVFGYSFMTGMKEDNSTEFEFEDFACENSGQYFQISANASENQLKKNIQQIYQIIARGQDFTKPRFSKMYMDAFGYGEMITIAQPIYYHDQQASIHYLVGVAAIDIPKKQLLKLQTNITEIQRRLQNPNEYKIINLVNSCKKYSMGAALKPPFIKIFKQVFRNPQSIQIVQCCGLKWSALVGILAGVGALIVGVAVAGLVYCSCKKKKQKKKIQQQQIRKKQRMAQEALSSQRQLSYLPTVDSQLRIFPVPPPGIFD